MSGGHWDYDGYRTAGYLRDRMGGDVEVMRRFPDLAKLLIDLGGWVGKVDHELDWDLSGDTQIAREHGSDDIFERAAITELLELAMKAAPDDLFPRGKWATIQAIQDRFEAPE